MRAQIRGLPLAEGVELRGKMGPTVLSLPTFVGHTRPFLSFFCSRSLPGSPKDTSQGLPLTPRKCGNSTCGGGGPRSQLSLPPSASSVGWHALADRRSFPATETSPARSPWRQHPLGCGLRAAGTIPSPHQTPSQLGHRNYAIRDSLSLLGCQLPGAFWEG